MQQKIYTIRDCKAELYNQPFFAITHGDAERQFTRLRRDKNTQVGSFPEDFDLYHVGTYDQEKGVITPLDTPQHIIKAVAISEQ